MPLPLNIARRYLFSKKSHSAINIVSLISVCGVAVGPMRNFDDDDERESHQYHRTRAMRMRRGRVNR